MTLADELRNPEAIELEALKKRIRKILRKNARLKLVVISHRVLPRESEHYWPIRYWLTKEGLYAELNDRSELMISW